ncbi:alpha/beta hydrolase fold domain-containing protein [Nocardia sp. CDC153]|uniref:alpha/beta hydrolase n=1 Tax=Nocardia sp. CDC153 TaxID=3112167 RepID=UPI002DBE22D0|nr:alpha/beta hydrolase fold domain-containing protein [Nocardia sp. CDC153]MEC3953515.1 alpha/beta hydrolase fold domain-containing protein [Nocardia sp. CDC153]
MAIQPQTSDPASTVIVETIRPARLGTRLVHPVLRTTLQQFLRAGAWVADRGPRPAKLIFTATRLSEQPARILGSPRGIRREPVVFERFDAEWLWGAPVPDPRVDREAALLYFHGGAFIAGGLNSYRRHTARLATLSELPVLTVDYRQLPDAHPNDSLDDALTAYRHLLAEGFPPEQIIVAGDSAGGGLALRLALTLRELGLPLPVALSVTSPWADFDSTARLAHPNARYDAVLPAVGPDMVVRRGIAIDGVLDPSWSVVNHDFTGLPPILLQVGSREMLLADALAVARRAESAGVPLRLQIRPSAPHTLIHLGADLLADGRDAARDAADFHRAMIESGRADRTAA